MRKNSFIVLFSHAAKNDVHGDISSVRRCPGTWRIHSAVYSQYTALVYAKCPGTVGAVQCST